jgi:hypothetical protein
LPIGFTVGLLRERLFRAQALGDVAVRLGSAVGPSEVQAVVAETLRDPQLQLAFWLDARGAFVGPDGEAVGPGRRSTTLVEREGHRVALRSAPGVGTTIPAAIPA